MKAGSAEEKRALASYLEKNDPALLEFLKTVSGAFGPLEKVEYRSNNNVE